MISLSESQKLCAEQHDAHPDLDSQSSDALFWLGDNIPGGFFLYRADESQEILYTNRATRTIYGCSTVEEFRRLTGNTFIGMVHPDDYQDIQKSIDRQIADSANDNYDYAEYRIRRADGEIRWVEDYGRFATIPEYGDVYYVFISDVTDKRRAQDEAFQTELALAHEKNANEAKASFLFNLSHDIRTPMNAIVGYSELAKRHIDSPELLAEYIDIMVSSSKQLLYLIDDMLEMSNLELSSPMMKPELALLQEELVAVANLFRIEADEKGIAFEEDYNLSAQEVLIDHGSFRRIMSNLVGNAVKFTPAGGTVRISATELASEKAGRITYEIKVADTGIGMTEEFMSRMYNAFEREESATVSGLVGTGLGLSIVKRLLEYMDGSIEAESSKGVGTTFTVRLSLESASQPKLATESTRLAGEGASDAGHATTAVAGARRIRPHSECRILVVDDVELNRMLAEAVLEDEGFLVDSVENGYEAVEIINRHPVWYYDLVLMDIQMPVMNGFEATKDIRALPRKDASKLPIIALSANTSDEDKKASFECGMNRHVAKPFDADALIEMIEELIAER